MIAPVEPAAVIPIRHDIILAEIPNEGRHASIAASEAELSALAEFAEIEAVTRFAAELDVKPWGRHGFVVTGTVSADVVQTCVVTLEPVENTVAEEIEVKLAPASDIERYKLKLNAQGEIEIDSEADDVPDFFDGPTVDLGAIAVEFFVLGLDPYPRKEGAIFEAPEDPDAAALSPFAKLLALKRET